MLGILRQRGIPIVTERRPPSPHHGDADDAYPELVRRTYQLWCEEHEQPPLVESFPLSRDPSRAETAAARRLLKAGREADAVFGVYSSSGKHILDAARDVQQRVPDDLLVAAISEDPAHAELCPPVTTVTLHPERLAAEGVDLLLALLSGRTDVSRERLVSHELVIRESTRPRPGS